MKVDDGEKKKNRGRKKQSLFFSFRFPSVSRAFHFSTRAVALSVSVA